MAIERKKELRRRRHRKAKLRKLKARLAAAKDKAERRRILEKIQKLTIIPPQDLV